MATQESVLNEERSHIGNIGGHWAKVLFGAFESDAWCAIFQWSCLTKQGVTGIPHSAWTPDWVSWAKRVGRWNSRTSGYVPQPGDLVLYMWSNVSPDHRGTPPVCHIGMFESGTAHSLYSIEGNTSGTVNGLHYDANLTVTHLRSGSIIQGFINMHGFYDGTVPPNPPDNVLVLGDTGPMVVDLQTRLIFVGYGIGSSGIDGVFGTETQAALMSFQGSHGLVPDGAYGPLSSRMLKSISQIPDVPDPPAPPDPNYFDITGIQSAVHATVDNVWGADTNARVVCVKAASNWGGGTFPLGIRFTQLVVGTPQDGVWGPASAVAHDETVRLIQSVVGVAADGIYGPETDAAVNTAHAKSNHTV
jgi:peptidoglycan hydrolase-like protein with peptidoglycan-binding domain